MWRDARALAGVALASAVTAPVAATAWLVSAWQRRRLAAPHRAAQALFAAGVYPAGPVTTEVLGGGRANAVVRVDDGARRWIVKRALPMGSVLAAVARVVGPQPFARDTRRATRSARERAALATLGAAGVRVPRVLGVDAATATLVLEDLAGVALPSTADAPGFATRLRAFGAALAAAHAAGVVLTDGHPGNALVTADGALALIDLEMAEPRATPTRRAFDLAYAAQYLDARERAALVAGFVDGGGRVDLAALRAAEHRLAPFAALFARERARQRGAR